MTDTPLVPVPAPAPARADAPIAMPGLTLLASDDDALVCRDDLCLPAGFEPAPGFDPATGAERARQPEEPAR